MKNRNLISQKIDKFINTIGDYVSWLVVIMILIQTLVVILRYVFSIGMIWMQELIWYCHGFFFTLATASTLLNNKHVSVDIILRNCSARTQSLVTFFGSIFLVLPFSAAIIYLSKSWVLNSWRYLEGSSEGAGLPLVFIIKTSLPTAGVLLFIAGFSSAMKSWYQITSNGKLK